MEYTPLARNESFSPVDHHRLLEAPPVREEFAPEPVAPQRRKVLSNANLSAERDGNEDFPDSRLSSILRSISSSHSYEAVNPEEQEGHTIAPLQIRKGDTCILSPAPTTSPTVMQSLFTEEPPARTASISRHLPLSHPRPDLQSMQGAYVKNVERLEEHAERLSMTSSLEEELQKMKLEQRQLHRKSSAPTRPSPLLNTSRKFSSTSLSNSITGLNAAARSGGYSPSGYVASPQDATKTELWSQIPGRSTSKSSRTKSHRQFSYESEEEEPPPLPPPHLTPYQAMYLSSEPDNSLHRQSSSATSKSDRPPTPASNDTYRQATTLFRDFDGVHYTAPSLLSHKSSLARQLSLHHPPLARDATVHEGPVPGEEMVFYPAPIPKMLNLPQKLSKQPTSDREWRRRQGLSAISTDMQNLAPWLSGEGDSTVGGENLRKNRQTLMSLPPQLRASAFFEQPATTDLMAGLELEGGSAVATLDKILDASAFAPVNVFVDHPIAGQVGSEVYRQEKKMDKRKSAMITTEKPQVDRENRKSSGDSLSNMLGIGRRGSGGTIDELGRSVSGESRMIKVEEDREEGKWKSLQDYANKIGDVIEGSIRPADDEVRGEAENGDDEEETKEPDELPSAFVNAPTTLLAELQMRKAKQKGRNLTAADVAGRNNGMYTTLLEMDAVTQLQLKSRKQKHVTLAWEDEREAEQMNYDDEDVPLGVLFPRDKQEKKTGAGGGLGGLLARKEMEDNEPLSRRRERLNPNAKSSRTKSTYAASTALRDDEENDGETLGMRLRRLKAEKEQEQEKPVVAGEFVNEVSNQLGLNMESDKKEDVPPPSRTPNVEETLGQRRKRLREEAETGEGASSIHISGGRAVSNGPMTAGGQPLKTRRSMADLLSAHPVGGPVAMNTGSPNLDMVTGVVSSGASKPERRESTMPVNGLNSAMFAGTPSAFPQRPQQFGMPMQMPFMNVGTMAMSGPQLFSPQSYQPSVMNGIQNGHGAAYGYGYGYGPGQALPNSTTMAMNMNMNAAMGATPGMAVNVGMGPPLDPKQRDGIERWRQSVVS